MPRGETMNKIYITLIIVVTGVALASHVDLDPAKKLEFAQKRKDMMNKQIETKKAQVRSIETAIASLKIGNTDQKKLSALGAQFTQLKEETDQLIQDLKITENSIKALMAKK